MNYTKSVSYTHLDVYKRQIQPGKDDFESIKQNRSTFFGNQNPLVLELACGKGEYLSLIHIFSEENQTY